MLLCTHTHVTDDVPYYDCTRTLLMHAQDTYIFIADRCWIHSISPPTGGKLKNNPERGRTTRRGNKQQTRTRTKEKNTRGRRGTRTRKGNKQEEQELGRKMKEMWFGDFCRALTPRKKIQQVGGYLVYYLCCCVCDTHHHHHPKITLLTCTRFLLPWSITSYHGYFAFPMKPTFLVSIL